MIKNFIITTLLILSSSVFGQDNPLKVGVIEKHKTTIEEVYVYTQGELKVISYLIKINNQPVVVQRDRHIPRRKPLSKGDEITVMLKTYPNTGLIMFTVVDKSLTLPVQRNDHSDSFLEK